MRVRILFFVLLAAFICGCSSDRLISGHGDVGPILLKQGIICGASPYTNSLPSISGRWRYSRYSNDKDGFFIVMSSKQFPAVQKFLLQAFGVPHVGPPDLIYQFPEGMIWVMDCAEETEIHTGRWATTTDERPN